MSDVKAIVTDIEGTTTSIDFVHDVLFPYAARTLPNFIRRHGADRQVAPLLDDVRTAANEPDASSERLTQILQEWISEDRKVTALKALQGEIWERGYRNADFTGHLYADAAPKLRGWFDCGIALYVYSSGSAKAQELLFGHSDAGDLRPLFSGYFDTRIGHKRDAASYRAIVERIGVPAGTILFLSDVPEELDAAADAGMKTMQLLRDDSMRRGRHPVAHDFNEVIV